jgi:hypothetical protein
MNYANNKELADFSEQLRNDPELAWAWHCNIAMIGIDSGANPTEMNERVADFMYQVFGVDTKSYLARLKQCHGNEVP